MLLRALGRDLQSVTKVFYHANHEAPSLIETEFVDMIALPPRPDKTFLTKKDFVDWSSNPATEHCYYNFYEPRDCGTRITKDNPPAFLHGFCADFDVKDIDQSAVERAIKDCPPAFPVAYVSRTFSRGIRMVWLFENPLPVFNEDVAKAVAKRAIKELKLKKLCAGFDEEAFIDPAKFYELGTEWRACSPDRTIPTAHLATWAFEASGRVKFEGRNIPIETVAAEAEKRWPGRWQGEFAVGAQGVRFWVPGSDSYKGAWIRETGVQDFVEGKFLHWDVIFGKEWVAQFEADRIGGAIGNTYYDSKGYWRKDPDGVWRCQNSEVFRRSLATRGGLNSEKIRGAASEVDRAMNVVEEDNRLDGAFPFLYSDKDIHVLRNKRYLNTSVVRAITPEPGVHFWGEGFPWLASFVEGLFDTEQREVFLSWFAYAYQAALQKHARQGHALFIVGDTGSGKTLLGTKVIAPALGGGSEGTSFIMGEDMFNSELFESGVWNIDDNKIEADERKHDLYSQTVKKVVANPSMTYRRMYAEGLTLPWMGRLVVTLNPDAIDMLPNVESNLLDKVLFLDAKDPNISFTGCEEKIIAELPAFLSYLRDWTIPEKLKDPRNNRFGLRSYHHPSLLSAAKASAPSANFAEIVDQWRTSYFTYEASAPEWTGTSLQFQQRLNECDSLTQIVRQYVRGQSFIGRCFKQMLAHGTPWLSFRSTNKGNLYTIKRP